MNTSNITLIVASNNKHKIKEIKEILGTRFKCVLSLLEADIDIDVEETGETFLDNALIKAREIFKVLGGLGKTDCAVLSDDSGLEVDALGGAPGVYSARYSGQGDEANNEKLLLELDKVQDRSANYTCVVALIMGEAEIVGEGRCGGTILRQCRGEGGFGYDPLFLSTDLNKTFAECTDEEKNSVSHRKRALVNLLQQL